MIIFMYLYISQFCSGIRGAHSYLKHSDFFIPQLLQHQLWAEDIIKPEKTGQIIAGRKPYLGLALFIAFGTRGVGGAHNIQVRAVLQ